MRLFIALLTIAAAAAIASGCGDGEASGYGSSASTEAAGASTASAETVARQTAGTAAARRGPRVKVIDSAYGRVIADGKGEAFYLFGREKGPKSRCYGACASAWPPVLAKAGGPVAVGEADRELLGTTRRRDGKLQVTYAGNLLYHYVHDAPGEILCHDVVEYGGLWLVVKPNGRPAA